MVRRFAHLKTGINSLAKEMDEIATLLREVAINHTDGYRPAPDAQNRQRKAFAKAHKELEVILGELAIIEKDRNRNGEKNYDTNEEMVQVMTKVANLGKLPFMNKDNISPKVINCMREAYDWIIE